MSRFWTGNLDNGVVYVCLFEPEIRAKITDNRMGNGHRQWHKEVQQQVALNSSIWESP